MGIEMADTSRARQCKHYKQPETSPLMSGRMAFRLGYVFAHRNYPKAVLDHRPLFPAIMGQCSSVKPECVKRDSLCRRARLQVARPAEDGNWHTIYIRMSHGSKAGVLDRVFAHLQQRHIVRIKIEVVALNSISIRVHPEGTGWLGRLKKPSVNILFVNSALAGKWAQQVQKMYHMQVITAVRPAGFVALAKRWLVERAHTRNDRATRLIMHHDRLHIVSEAWV